jgi:hypothetical protein
LRGYGVLFIKVSQYFIDDTSISDASNDGHIMPLAFLTFGNGDVENALLLAGHRALSSPC